LLINSVVVYIHTVYTFNSLFFALLDSIYIDKIYSIILLVIQWVGNAKNFLAWYSQVLQKQSTKETINVTGYGKISHFVMHEINIELSTSLCYHNHTYVPIKIFQRFSGNSCSVHTYFVLTIRLTCTVKSIALAINIGGVKCDQVVDFPKSGHKYKISYSYMPAPEMCNKMLGEFITSKISYS